MGLWTYAEVSEYLRLSEAKVRQMVAERVMPCVRFGRSVRFRRSDVDRWLEQQVAGQAG